jgi:8-oxo-dGTP diphosphatase
MHSSATGWTSPNGSQRHLGVDTLIPPEPREPTETPAPAVPPQPPEPPPIRVLAAVIRRDGRLLLCRRPAHKRHGGLWEIPGGKLEPGEELFDAARRELDEELGLQATSVGDVVFECQDPGSPFLILFAEVQASGDPVPTEHAEVRWLTPVEAGRLPLAPADAAFISALMAEE